MAGPGLAPLILLTLRGGAGADQVTGGDGAELIEGGGGADVLIGGDGDDRIAGDRGNDAMAGGGGDDTLVWRDGDGSDRADGEAGYDTTEVHGAPGAGDVFTVAAAGERTRLDRTTWGPFAIDMATEVLDLRALGGDDALTVADGAAVQIVAHGGSGKDALTGGDGDDTLRGGSGDDTLTGRAGLDALEGGDGDDLIDARDGALVRCGAGADQATLDPAILDQQAGCETLDRSPAPEPAPRPGAVQLRVAKVPVRDRRVRLPLRCPASATGGCRGEAVLQTVKPIRVRGVRAIVQLGSARYELGAGEAGAVAMTLPRGFRRLAPRHARRLDARVLLRNEGSVFRARKLALTLRRP